ncbi:hypothetical protein [Wenxinia marina]|uniref:DUF4189 domain-containing protein n=1 Tax=Wenxinia marina DSM 24838 TaxID=1123501 RepID=A0A0D0Q6C6_9RHOB|nr:hypothetical protein [Wenxinia marina]KIQ68012.1 hypothetical protein Wenmar_03468 [Wenxinia marina DSM 24838]GGL75411.1 hypothetical protein GCM10011392_32580 [Wenxinia marina]
MLTLIAGLVLGAAAPALPDLPGHLEIDFQLPAERVILYPPSGELRMLSGLRLSPEAQQAFDTEFRPTTYFSAFATSKSGGWGYATTTNSAEAARAIAMGECRSSNDDCILVAEIVPRGYREPGPGDITMTPEVAELYRNPAAAGAPDGAARAMAISADGAYALVWGLPDQAAADGAAISDCGQHLNHDLPGVEPMPCFVVPGLPGTN